jgi:hypothetical protein
MGIDPKRVLVRHKVLIEQQSDHGHIGWLIPVVVDGDAAAGDNSWASNIVVG